MSIQRYTFSQIVGPIKHSAGEYVMHSDHATLLAAKDAEIERLKARLAADHRFREAPCPICDYNGPGYFQPDQHPCAAMYHAAQRAKLHVTNQKDADAAALKESPNA